MSAKVWLGAMVMAALGAGIAVLDQSSRPLTPASTPAIQPATSPPGGASTPAPATPPDPARTAPSNAQAAPAPSTPPSSPPAVPPPSPESVTVEQAFALMNQGAIFVDARYEHEFEAGHVAFAYHIPPAMFAQGGAAWDHFFANVDKSMPIVVYCGGGDCDASKSAMKALRHNGYTTIHIMDAGFGAWKAAGHPVAAGAWSADGQ